MLALGLAYSMQSTIYLASSLHFKLRNARLLISALAITIGGMTALNRYQNGV